VFIFLYRLGLAQIRLGRQQQDFIAAVSHELKTPLTSIRMFSEMLREGWVNKEKQKEYYDFICDESERLTRLITNVLQLARMERKELQLTIKPVEVGTVVDMIQSRLQSLTQQSGFKANLQCEPEDRALAINADLDALIQILLNLADNAVKFSANSEHRQIDICARKKNNKVEFSVRDYGPGVPPRQQQKRFSLFYRAGNELTRETQGTGIGLALVRQLSRAMHGDVSVRNVSPGAEFTLWLPLAEE